MNSRRGNPMSEHARGNAIDVGKFVLKNGKEIAVRKRGFFAFRERGLLKAVRTDSCKASAHTGNCGCCSKAV